MAYSDIDVNVKNDDGETSFFFFDCERGQGSVVQVLLKDPRVDITLDDDNGRTALWIASSFGEHEVIEWFIASGRDLGDFKNKNGRDWDSKSYTALEIAREENHTEVVSCWKDSWPTQHRPSMRFV